MVVATLSKRQASYRGIDQVSKSKRLNLGELKVCFKKQHTTEEFGAIISTVRILLDVLVHRNKN